jgi:hypothetical protein
MLPTPGRGLSSFVRAIMVSKRTQGNRLLPRAKADGSAFPATTLCFCGLLCNLFPLAHKWLSSLSFLSFKLPVTWATAGEETLMAEPRGHSCLQLFKAIPRSEVADLLGQADTRGRRTPEADGHPRQAGTRGLACAQWLPCRAMAAMPHSA